MQIEIRNFIEKKQNTQFNDIFNITKNININNNDTSLNKLKRLCLKFCIILLNY